MTEKMIQSAPLTNRLTNSYFRGLRSAVSRLTLTEVFALLNLLDSYYLTCVVCGVREKDKTASKMCPFAQWGSTADLFLPARNTGILWFHGGPPAHTEWHIGTAATFTVDCLLEATTRLGRGFVISKLATIYREKQDE